MTLLHIGGNEHLSSVTVEDVLKEGVNIVLKEHFGCFMWEQMYYCAFLRGS
jgi:hypothetical protein